MSGWSPLPAPDQAMLAIVVVFAFGAAAIVGWTILTHPTLLRGLLSDGRKAFTLSRLQLLVAAPAALAAVSSASDDRSAFLAAFGISNLGYLTGKILPRLSGITGGKQS